MLVDCCLFVVCRSLSFVSGLLLSFVVTRLRCAGCLLLGVSCLVVCCLSFAVCCLLFAVLVFVVRCLLFAVCRLSYDGFRLPFDIVCGLFVVV